MLKKLAAGCYRHRWMVLILWIVILIGVNMLAKASGDNLLKTFSLPGTESQATFDVLKKEFARPGDTGDLVFKVKGGGAVQDQKTQDEVTAIIAKMRAVKNNHIIAVDTPWDSRGGQRFVSPTDPDIAYAELTFDQQANDLPKDAMINLRSVVDKANSPTLQAELGGQMFTDQSMPASEFIGILAAIIILLIAFGSLLAMGLPIITALFGIGTGIALVTLLSHITDVPSFAPQVTAMIGIGVGIDYALFISTRYRETLHDGYSPEDSVVHTLDTSGHAVLFAGGTVVISLLGLFLIGVSFIRGLAIGASLAVLLVMAAAVTLLPAILGFVGYTIDKFALPTAKHPKPVDQTFWARWSRVLQKRPWPFAILGLVILLVLAIPAFGLRLGVSDQGNDPKSTTTRQAYDLLTEGFGPGFNGPLLVVAENNHANDGDTMAKLAAAIKTTPGVAPNGVSDVIASPNGRGFLINVVPAGFPQDESTTQLVHRLRDNVVPAVTDGTGVNVHVGGQTALGVDLADTLGQRLPYMFIAILLLSFLLLMLVFRSLLVPLKAVIMNLLSIAAAYGVIVAIFQNGWLKGVFGVSKAGPIEAWVPMMLFAIVFGLSMDYEVFLLSRIKEEYDVTHDNANAVAHGLAKTGRLITAAAAIMICVFGSFALSNMRVLQLIGIGLASAVFIDATIVRMVLVPATMELLGDRNWWFPKMLEWLPRVNVEGGQLGEVPVATPEPVGVGD